MSIKVTIDPIYPVKTFLDVKRYQRAIQNAGNMSAKAVEVDFHVTTRTWEHQPKFEIYHDAGSDHWEVSTDDEIYGYVSDGTAPHKIVPNRATVLRFYPGSSPKSKIGWIGSKKGRKGHGKPVFTKEVMHPGIDAREFELDIKDKWDAEWPRQIARAIKAANAYK